MLIDVKDWGVVCNRIGNELVKTVYDYTRDKSFSEKSLLVKNSLVDFRPQGDKFIYAASTTLIDIVTPMPKEPKPAMITLKTRPASLDQKIDVTNLIIESIKAICSAKDRLYFAMLDTSTRTMKQQKSVKAWTFSTIERAIKQAKFPVAKIFVAANLFNDFNKVVRDEVRARHYLFHPTTIEHAEKSTHIGDLDLYYQDDDKKKRDVIEVFSDAFFHPELKVMEQDTIWLVAKPEEHGIHFSVHNDITVEPFTEQFVTNGETLTANGFEMSYEFSMTMLKPDSVIKLTLGVDE